MEAVIVQSQEKRKFPDATTAQWAAQWFYINVYLI